MESVVGARQPKIEISSFNVWESKMPGYSDFPACEPRCPRCNAAFDGPKSFPPEPDDLVECADCQHSSQAEDWFHYELPKADARVERLERI